MDCLFFFFIETSFVMYYVLSGKPKEEHGESQCMKWNILRRAKSGRISGSSCRLCQEENLAIGTYKDCVVLLNGGIEIMSKCRQVSKNVLGLYNLG